MVHSEFETQVYLDQSLVKDKGMKENLFLVLFIFLRGQPVLEKHAPQASAIPCACKLINGMFPETQKQQIPLKGLSLNTMRLFMSEKDGL